MLLKTKSRLPRVRARVGPAGRQADDTGVGLSGYPWMNGTVHQVTASPVSEVAPTVRVHFDGRPPSLPPISMPGSGLHINPMPNS